MKHLAGPSFWECYNRLSQQRRDQADKNFSLLKDDPRHPSLHIKKAGNYWSVRVGKRHRALAVEVDKGFCGSG